MPISTIKEGNKLIVVVMDIMIPAEYWPYQIIKTYGQSFSIVEESVYKAMYLDKKRQNTDTDPNQKYTNNHEELQNLYTSLKKEKL